MEGNFRKDFLVAVDSDGCAFDVMNVKHLEVFIPEAVAVFGLETYGDLYPEAARTVNLFSDLRGCNRFPALYCSLELARRRLGRPLEIPVMETFRDFLLSGNGLTREALTTWHSAHPAPVLGKVIEWNDRCNERFKSGLKESAPFTGVKEALQKAAAFADIVVCSAASRATLLHEWSAAGLDTFVTMIAGQENGTKAEQLLNASRAGGFDPEKVLMIGDAPGDHKAARTVGTCFFPIIPGDENHSWWICREEVLPAFAAGRYTTAVEELHLARFYRNLPACEVQPPAAKVNSQP